MNLWISLTKIENEVTLSWTGCKWAVHYEYATWGAFNLSLPLFTAPVSLWFLSLVLFNISLCCSVMGKPCFWLPVRCATSHCASTLHLSTHFLKGEENHTWTGSLDAENAQESVMLVWHRCWRKRLKGDRMFRVVTFIVFFYLAFWTQWGSCMSCAGWLSVFIDCCLIDWCVLVLIHLPTWPRPPRLWSSLQFVDAGTCPDPAQWGHLDWSCWKGSGLTSWGYENGPSCWLGFPHRDQLTGPGWCSLSLPPGPKGHRSGWWCWLPEWIVACVLPASVVR